MYISILVLDRFQWFHCQVKGLGKILRYTRGNIFWVLHLGLSQRKQIIFLTLERYIEKKKKRVQSHEDYGRTKYMECRICQSSWSLSEMTK